MKQKITLEQLSAYFPYQVKAKFRDKETGTEIGTIGQISDNCSIVCYDTVNAYHEKYKLMLRPLSWLTDENLKKIKLDNVYGLHRSDIQDIKSDCNGIYNLNIPYNIIRIMLKNHVDIFGLLEKGLAEEIKEK